MRESLIDAAIERFGKRGFDAVGTREIAAAVGTTMSSITYHFGGKEGLYLAAAEHIFDQLEQRLQQPAVEPPGEGADRESRIAFICGQLVRVGTFMLREESAPFALFIGREQQDPSVDVLRLMTDKMRPMMEAFVAQVAILRPDLDDRQARATTHFLFGMAIMLRHSRASLKILLDCEDIDTATGAMLLAQLEATARLVLEGPKP